ncbi:hypothetical protein GCM10010429_43100 [Micromonospora olivasterospora]
MRGPPETAPSGAAARTAGAGSGSRRTRLRPGGWVRATSTRNGPQLLWLGIDLPRRFFWFAGSAAASTAGLVTFGLISYHASQTGLIAVAAVPILYAGAMAAAAVTALASGHLYDRWGAGVLYALPALAAAVPALALSHSGISIIAGTVLWGAAVGVQDSTVKALVADLVPPNRRATAYGVFAAVQGVAALAGGGFAGALYSQSLPLLVTVLGAAQILAVVLLTATLAPRPGS